MIMRDVPELLQQRYDLCFKTLSIGRWLDIEALCVRDPDQLIDQIDSDAFEQEERLPYWSEIWPASIGLGMHLFEHPVSVHGAILELGCGIGVAGIAAAAAGFSVIACGYEAYALEFARFNARRNRVADRITYRLFDWRNPDFYDRFPLIIGSDIVYERADHQPIQELLEAMLIPGGAFLLSDPDRRPAGAFVERMVQAGYGHSAQPHRVRHEEAKIGRAHV